MPEKYGNRRPWIFVNKYMAVETTAQDGSTEDDYFRAAAAGLDGTSVVFAGSTYGSWANTHEGEETHEDFAGMAMDADKTVLWTYQVCQVGLRVTNQRQLKHQFLKVHSATTRPHSNRMEELRTRRPSTLYCSPTRSGDSPNTSRNFPSACSRAGCIPSRLRLASPVSIGPMTHPQLTSPRDESDGRVPRFVGET